MEAEIIKASQAALQGLDIPAFYDARGKLATNPNGKTWKSRDPKALKGMVWHQELGWGTVEQVASYHTGPQSHLYEGGVESIAYTWAIRRDGQIVLCNDLDKVVWSHGYAAREGDENAEFCSVMFEGIFKSPHFTDPSAGQPTGEQLLAGLLLWRVCKKIWSWSENRLYGHHLLGKPACPGDTLETIVQAVRANVQVPNFNLTTIIGRQQALKLLGYYSAVVDGIWGPYSKGALTRFQQDHGLVPDGVWGPISEATMLEALEKW